MPDATRQAPGSAFRLLQGALPRLEESPRRRENGVALRERSRERLRDILVGRAGPPERDRRRDGPLVGFLRVVDQLEVLQILGPRALLHASERGQGLGS